jgi:hypothetical protein
MPKEGKLDNSIKAVFSILTVILVSVNTSANTINVPGDSATIQAGINGALNGDTVLVASGVYTKGGNITNLSIFILSEKGPDSTILDGAGFGLVRGNSNTTEIDGFTFINTGHAINITGASPYIKNCIFKDNYYIAYDPLGDEGGAAISSSSSTSNIYISDCYFENNVAVGKYYNVFTYGGAVNIRGGTATIERCIFMNNYADNGGAVSILLNSYLSSYINNCIFIENYGGYEGGAIFAVACRIDHTNCTFYGNKAETSSGMALFCLSDFSNCIFAYNDGLQLCKYKPTSMTCTDVYGNTGGDWIDGIADFKGLDGNISLDPLFCDTANYDFHIAGSSPCAPGHPDNSCGTLIGALGIGCGTTDIDEDNNNTKPLSFALHQNYPNPFNPVTAIKYSLPNRSDVTIIIFDILGRKVKTVFNQTQPAGTYTTYWDGTDSENNQVAAGVYFYRLEAGDFVDTKKMLLLK